MKTKVVTTTEVVTDDLTKEEIRPIGGWELRGLRSRDTYHFQTLTNLIAFLLKGNVASSGYLCSDLAARFGIRTSRP